MRQMQRQVPGQPGIWNGSGRTWAWGGVGGGVGANGGGGEPGGGGMGVAFGEVGAR